MSLENQESNSYDTDDYQYDNSDEEYAPPDNNLSTQEKLDQVLNSQSIEKAKSNDIFLLKHLIMLKKHQKLKKEIFYHIKFRFIHKERKKSLKL